MLHKFQMYRSNRVRKGKIDGEETRWKQIEVPLNDLAAGERFASGFSYLYIFYPPIIIFNNAETYVRVHAVTLRAVILTHKHPHESSYLKIYARVSSSMFPINCGCAQEDINILIYN